MTTVEQLVWAYELDTHKATQVAHYVDQLKAKIANLEETIANQHAQRKGEAR